MKRLLLLPAIGCLLLSCAGLPQVQTAKGLTAAEIRQACLDHFPRHKWQFVHSIEAVIPGGNRVFVTGVAIISPADRSFQCVIMTLEGLVVFDAEYKGQLLINRAVPPFCSRAFAEGLVNDIRLIFLHPPGSPVESGALENGALICRHRNPDGSLVDVAWTEDHEWEIRLYAHDRLSRSVKITSGKNLSAGAFGVPEKIDLTASGSEGYKLKMRLIEAVPVNEQPSL